MDSNQSKHCSHLCLVTWQPLISPLARLLYVIINNAVEVRGFCDLSNNTLGGLLSKSSTPLVRAKLRELKDWNLIRIEGRKDRKIYCTFAEPVDPLREVRGCKGEVKKDLFPSQCPSGVSSAVWKRIKELKRASLPPKQDTKLFIIMDQEEL